MKKLDTGQKIWIGIVVLFMFFAIFWGYYTTQKNKLLMDEFCQDVRGTDMSEYKTRFPSSYIRFKCEGEDTVFKSDFTTCAKDEWGDTQCIYEKPKKSVLQNLLR